MPQAVQEHLVLEPVIKDTEGSDGAGARGFDPSAMRLTGNVTGQPPFKGTLQHHGWRVKELKLAAPPEGQDETGPATRRGGIAVEAGFRKRFRVAQPVNKGLEHCPVSRYVVGIDLGTTNSALAYVDTGAAAIRFCNICKSRRSFSRASSNRGRCCRRFSICLVPANSRPAA